MLVYYKIANQCSFKCLLVLWIRAHLKHLLLNSERTKYQCLDKMLSCNLIIEIAWSSNFPFIKFSQFICIGIPTRKWILVFRKLLFWKINHLSNKIEKKSNYWKHVERLVGITLSTETKYSSNFPSLMNAFLYFICHDWLFYAYAVHFQL